MNMMASSNATPISGETGLKGISLRRRIGSTKSHTKLLSDLYETRNTSEYEVYFKTINPNGIGLIDSIKFEEFQT